MVLSYGQIRLIAKTLFRSLPKRRHLIRLDGVLVICSSLYTMTLSHNCRSFDCQEEPAHLEHRAAEIVKVGADAQLDVARGRLPRRQPLPQVWQQLHVRAREVDDRRRHLSLWHIPTVFNKHYNMHFILKHMGCGPYCKSSTLRLHHVQATSKH